MHQASGAIVAEKGGITNNDFSGSMAFSPITNKLTYAVEVSLNAWGGRALDLSPLAIWVSFPNV